MSPIRSVESVYKPAYSFNRQTGEMVINQAAHSQAPTRVGTVIYTDNQLSSPSTVKKVTVLSNTLFLIFVKLTRGTSNFCSMIDEPGSSKNSENFFPKILTSPVDKYFFNKGTGELFVNEAGKELMGEDTEAGSLKIKWIGEGGATDKQDSVKKVTVLSEREFVSHVKQEIEKSSTALAAGLPSIDVQFFNGIGKKEDQ